MIPAFPFKYQIVISVYLLDDKSFNNCFWITPLNDSIHCIRLKVISKHNIMTIFKRKEIVGVSHIPIYTVNRINDVFK